MGLACTVVLGILFTTCQAYEYAHAGFAFAHHIYGSTFFMATGFHGFHVIVGTIFLTVCLFRAHAAAISPRSSISASRRPPGTGTSSTWYGCSCSPASMCGAPAATIRLAKAAQVRAFRGGGLSGRPLCVSIEAIDDGRMPRRRRRSKSFGATMWAGHHRPLSRLRSRQAVRRLSHARATLQCLRARLRLRRFRRRACRLRHPGDGLHRGRRGADRRGALRPALLAARSALGLALDPAARSSCFASFKGVLIALQFRHKAEEGKLASD